MHQARAHFVCKKCDNKWDASFNKDRPYSSMTDACPACLDNQEVISAAPDLIVVQGGKK